MSQSELDALRREGEMYLSVGEVYRAGLVNEQIVLRGGDPLVLPVDDAKRRPSAAAATRKKAVKKNG